MKKLNWGWRIIIAYVVFITGTMSWVTIAMTSRVDLVRPDYYEHSLVQDAVMTARAAGVASGATLRYDRRANAYQIRILERGASGSLSLYRPDDPGRDRTITLALGADGIMTIPTASLRRGVWRATLDWKSPAGLSRELVTKDTL